MEGKSHCAKPETKVYVHGEVQNPMIAKKLRYFALAILLLFLVMTVVVAASMILALQASNGEKTIVYQSITASEKPSTAYQKSRVNCMEEQVKS